jgi:hypothetical protein
MTPYLPRKRKKTASGDLSTYGLFFLFWLILRSAGGII